MKRKNVSNKKRIKSAREEYYEQLNSEEAAEDREKFYIGFYRRAVAENNCAFQDIIVSDAAFRWNMFQDEVRDFLNRSIGAIVSEPAAA